MKRKLLLAGLLLTATTLQAQDAGSALFTQHCASCHGTDGNGGELGPNIATRVPLRSDMELTNAIRQGFTAAGMPAFATMTDTETTALIAKLRTLKPRFGTTPEHRELTLADGSKVAGLVLNESMRD